MQSINYPDMYLRHAFFMGELSRVSTDLDRADATFDIVTGLADPSWVSFRSTNYPDRYLRHQNFRVKLDPLGDQQMREDATFAMRSGLADGAATSFSAYNSGLREYYIRHKCFSLYLEKITGDLDRRDATFRVGQGFSPQGSSEATQVVDIVNFARARENAAQNGCRAPRLVIDSRLTTAAQQHSQDLADHPGQWEKLYNGYPGHIGSDGSTPDQRIQSAVGSSGRENVYITWRFGNTATPGPQAALDSWWNSAPHKATILDWSLNTTGVGIATGQGIIPRGQRDAGKTANFKYVTQTFHT
ncbi:AbfB domain-containing protein [Nocardia seriolae]|nr:AbfB domain-containing protein [Nocardia seriolae]